jgi:NAD(P)-dependent dehydrogenase (short-subunit alcohol dehydrogenase family)
LKQGGEWSDEMNREKTVLVTGASSGIGRVAARLLAQRGYTVFGTSRDPACSEPIEGAELLPLDVRDDASATACVETIIERTGRLDILVNNAGYALAGSLEETSLAEAKAQFETNFFGVARMVNAVLPHMRAQRAGRIVTTGSLAGMAPIPFMGFYSAIKFALEGYCETLRQELKPFGIHVALVEPGWIKTALGEHLAQSSEQIADYAPWRDRALGAVMDMIAVATPPEVVAGRILKIIETGRPRLRNSVGNDAKIVLWLRRLAPVPVYDMGVRSTFRLDKAA